MSLWKSPKLSPIAEVRERTFQLYCLAMRSQGLTPRKELPELDELWAANQKTLALVDRIEPETAGEWRRISTLSLSSRRDNGEVKVAIKLLRASGSAAASDGLATTSMGMASVHKAINAKADTAEQIHAHVTKAIEGAISVVEVTRMDTNWKATVPGIDAISLIGEREGARNDLVKVLQMLKEKVPSPDRAVNTSQYRDLLQSNLVPVINGIDDIIRARNVSDSEFENFAVRLISGSRELTTLQLSLITEMQGDERFEPFLPSEPSRDDATAAGISQLDYSSARFEQALLAADDIPELDPSVRKFLPEPRELVSLVLNSDPLHPEIPMFPDVSIPAPAKASLDSGI